MTIAVYVPGESGPAATIPSSSPSPRAACWPVRSVIVRTGLRTAQPSLPWIRAVTPVPSFNALCLRVTQLDIVGVRRAAADLEPARGGRITGRDDRVVPRREVLEPVRPVLSGRGHGGDVATRVEQRDPRLGYRRSRGVPRGALEPRPWVQFGVEGGLLPVRDHRGECRRLEGRGAQRYRVAPRHQALDGVQSGLVRRGDGDDLATGVGQGDRHARQRLFRP